LINFIFYFLILFQTGALSSYGKSINSLLKTSKNLKNETVQAARLGTTEDSSLSTAYSNWQKGYVSYMVKYNATARRRKSGLFVLAIDPLCQLN